MKKDTMILLGVTAVIGLFFSLAYSIQDGAFNPWPFVFFFGFPNRVIGIVSLVTKKNQW